MNTPRIARAPRPSASAIDIIDRHELSDVIIGKDVLELVSSAMYIDPMTVYREYIQNAADAVDEARKMGLLSADEPGRVEINVDPASRSVRIRDNGCGVPFENFGKKLTAIGGSKKRGTSARGFRGVGRLAGLGYAQELIFRSRVAGEDKISELKWDCRRLRTALRDSNDLIEIADVIRDVTVLQRVQADNIPERFFEVELRGIVRQRNDRLMSPAAIKEYLGQVAPVPFSPQFKLGGKLTEKLAEHVRLGILNIYVDGSEDPIYRPHRDTMHLDDNYKLTLEDLTFTEIPGVEGDIAALAWILHHEYEGAIPNSAHVKGLRLRAGNIQVGDNALLEDLFPEPRFNAWSVGEIHIIDQRIVPNGRRDHFEQTAHFNNLVNHLSPTARDIARRCRTSSIQRKWEREFEVQKRIVVETLDIAAQGSTTKTEMDRLLFSAEEALSKLVKIASNKAFMNERAAKDEIIQDLRKKLDAMLQGEMQNKSPLRRLPESQQAKYRELFDLIYDCSVNRVAAKALVDRIIAKITS